MPATKSVQTDFIARTCNFLSQFFLLSYNRKFRRYIFKYLLHTLFYVATLQQLPGGCNAIAKKKSQCSLSFKLTILAEKLRVILPVRLKLTALNNSYIERSMFCQVSYPTQKKYVKMNFITLTECL